MSEITKKLLENTSKPLGAPALLVLEDGAVFSGTSCAAQGEVFGEICFNTSLEGYLEVITDPELRGPDYHDDLPPDRQLRCEPRGLPVREAGTARACRARYVSGALELAQ